MFERIWSCEVIYSPAHFQIEDREVMLNFIHENPSKGVPTWNYSTVIIEGVAEIIDSSEWLLGSVIEFTDKFEKDSSWKDSVDKDYLENLSKGIVGVKNSSQRNSIKV